METDCCWLKTTFVATRSYEPHFINLAIYHRQFCITCLFAWNVMIIKLAVSSSVRSELKCFSQLSSFKEPSATGKVLIVQNLSTELHVKRCELLLFSSWIFEWNSFYGFYISLWISAQFKPFQTYLEPLQPESTHLKLIYKRTV